MSAHCHVSPLVVSMRWALLHSSPLPPSSPSTLTFLTCPSIAHCILPGSQSSNILVDCYFFNYRWSKSNDFVMVSVGLCRSRRPPPPSSPSPFTSLACPSIACCVLPGHNPQLIVIFKGRRSKQFWMGGVLEYRCGRICTPCNFWSMCAQFLSRGHYTKQIALSRPPYRYPRGMDKVIYQRNQYWLQQFAPIPWFLVMVCWCQNWQKRGSSAVLWTLDGWRRKHNLVVIASWVFFFWETIFFGSNGQTNFSILPQIFFPYIAFLWPDPPFQT